MDLATQVVCWQQVHGRHDLPWQNTRDPYRVWLSEIMLQQTQVTTILRYFPRFLERFPNVSSLAAAPLDDVLGMWSGLGYYSRARNLHSCAVEVMQGHGGRFPTTAQLLQTLPGIGRSTAAAIASLCFGERVAIMDGNVRRVLTRLLGFRGDLAEAPQERALWTEATRLLPDAGMEAYTQGLMDLGATVCSQRAPACLLCPVRSLCVACREGQPERYPVKSRRLKRSRRENHWVSLAWRDRLWLVQRPPRGIWASLWSLSEFESNAAFAATSAAWPGETRSLASFTHVLTHLDWRLHPVQHAFPDQLDSVALAGCVASMPEAANGRWFERAEVAGLGLPAALRKLLPLL